ncbi:MAG: hypothetical protein AAGH64_04450 [Planctomycetota bacterium]
MTPWFDPATAGLIGGIGGATVGVLFGAVGGAAGGYFAPRGQHKRLIVGYFIAWGVLGVLALATGLVALTTSQPYHVYYTFLLQGFLVTALTATLIPVLLKRYRQAEERLLDAEQLRGL